MPSKIPREQAYTLLTQYVTTEQLIKHALAVEATMRRFAREFSEDEDTWGVIGLIHDLDYEKWPDQHCVMTEKLLKENDWPEEYIRAVLCHGYGICTDVQPQTNMEITLYAIDELTGLVTAAALVRPSKSVNDLEVKSLKKKWKDKAFAAGANRQVISNGAEMLGMPLEQLMQLTIEGMREAAAELGLAGQGA